MHSVCSKFEVQTWKIRHKQASRDKKYNYKIKNWLDESNSRLDITKKKISELKNTAIKTIQNVPLGEKCILERKENPIKLESVRCGTNSKQSNIWVLIALKNRGRRRKKYLNKLQSKTVK